MNEINLQSGPYVRYEQQQAIIRFTGPVEANSVFRLCDEIDFAIEYYFYPQITIEIDSPGGEANSLLYFIDKLKGWRGRGIRIRTLALTKCSSAAAFMLSLGDIGYRTAMPRASLLYHNASFYASSEQSLTSDRLEQLRSSLTRTDADLMVTLLRHFYDNFGDERFDFLEELVCNLPYPEHKVNSQKLKLVKAPRMKKILTALDTTSISVDTVRIRQDCYTRLITYLRDLLPKVSQVKDMSGIRTVLETAEPMLRNELAAAWLLFRFEHYQALFRKDSFISPEDAVTEGLMDIIKE